jgi:hypothetical protein
VNEQQWDWDDWYKKLENNCKRWTNDYEAVLGYLAGLRTGSSSSAGDTTGSSSSSGCAALNNRTTHVFFYEDLKGPSGELNTQFLDQLLQLLGVDKADSYYECALAFSEGRFKRSYPQDASHPAVQVLTDGRSQQIVASAGCLDAYRAAQPRLLPLPN